MSRLSGFAILLATSMETKNQAAMMTPTNTIVI